MVGATERIGRNRGWKSLAAGDVLDTVVGVFGTDLDSAPSQSSVFALLRRLSDGAPLTDKGTIAAGTNISELRALHDGTTFRVFYLSEVTGRHQVHTAALRCE